MESSPIILIILAAIATAIPGIIVIVKEMRKDREYTERYMDRYSTAWSSYSYTDMQMVVEPPVIKKDVLAKCSHCGQWTEDHSDCKYCGAPVENDKLRGE